MGLAGGVTRPPLTTALGPGTWCAHIISREARPARLSVGGGGGEMGRGWGEGGGGERR